MSEFNVFDIISRTLAVAKHENDDDDKNSNLRTGYGNHIFTRDYIQKYEGQFLYNNIHGQGKYTWLCKDGNGKYDDFLKNLSVIYVYFVTGYILEDSFYANKVEGYSSIYYNNCGLFEGLFKSNKRYGPGVFTNENGLQDVGLWDGLSLIRLSCQIYSKWIPKLGQSKFGKIKLLKYRKLVPVCNPKTNKARNILQNLNAPEEVLNNAHLLYNEHIRNEESLLFDKDLYDELFFGEQNCVIDVISNEMDLLSTSDCTSLTSTGYKSPPITPTSEVNYLLYDDRDILMCECEICEDEKEEEKTQEELLNIKRDTLKSKYLERVKTKCKFNTTKIPITNILAWNNETHLIAMLSYCFRFRSMEENMSFNVQSLLAGFRERFQKCGQYEEVCRQFLMNCSEDNYLDVMQLSNDYYINPDLCDSNGNTGIMFSAARDSRKTIETLVNLGSNVDSLNDEGLTPLTMCILRYTAVLKDVQNWEKAFVSISILL